MNSYLSRRHRIIHRSPDRGDISSQRSLWVVRLKKRASVELDHHHCRCGRICPSRIGYWWGFFGASGCVVRSLTRGFGRLLFSPSVKPANGFESA